jgi:hypothetical protein
MKFVATYTFEFEAPKNSNGLKIASRALDRGAAVEGGMTQLYDGVTAVDIYIKNVNLSVKEVK